MLKHNNKTIQRVFSNYEEIIKIYKNGHEVFSRPTPSTSQIIYSTDSGSSVDFAQADFGEVEFVSQEHDIEYDLWTATFSGNILEIGESGITENEYINLVYIPSTVTNIKDYAFYGCKNLHYINIPNSVTTLGDGALAHCTYMQVANIGAGCTSIGDDLFAYNNNLKTIICKAEEAPSLSTNSLRDLPSGGKLIVPEDADYSEWISQLSNWQVEYRDL